MGSEEEEKIRKTGDTVEEVEEGIYLDAVEEEGDTEEVLKEEERKRMWNLR